MLYSLSDMQRVNMRMLAARLATRAREEFWRAYTAAMQQHIIQMLTCGKAEIKSYVDMLGDTPTTPIKAQNDTRTAQEIADDIRTKLLGGAMK